MAEINIPEMVYGVGSLANAYEDLATLQAINQKLSDEQNSIIDFSELPSYRSKIEFQYLIDSREDIADMIRRSLITASRRSLSDEYSGGPRNTSIESFIGYTAYAGLIRANRFRSLVPVHPSVQNSQPLEDEHALKVLSMQKGVPIITTEPRPEGGIILSDPKVLLQESTYLPDSLSYIGLSFIGSVLIDRDLNNTKIKILKFNPNTLSQIIVGSHAINNYFISIKDSFQKYKFGFKLGLANLITNYKQTAEDKDDLRGAIDFSQLNA